MTSGQFVKSSQAIVAEIDDQVVALDIQQGICYGLDAIATRIFALMEEPRSLEDLCAVLTDEFDVGTDQCRTDVSALLSDLEAANLVVRA